MSNFSRTAVSLAPAYFHHWRSNSRISRSRSLRLGVAPRSGPWRAFAASMRSLSRKCWNGGGTTVGDEPHRCHSPLHNSPGESAGPSTARIAGLAATVRGQYAPRMAPTDDQPIGWGILATGKIAHSFAQDLALVPGARLAAVGSRRPESAAAFAETYGAPAAHGSYEALVADPTVDVVYVATPHALHLDHVRLALEAGKHVLCEKPVTLTAGDAEEMVRLAREHDRFLME